MRTIQLTTKDIVTLKNTNNPVYIFESKIAICSPRSYGTVQSGWIILDITLDEVNTLWKGCKIQNREFTLLPGIHEDVFCGYKGAKFFDINYNTSNNQ